MPSRASFSLLFFIVILIACNQPKQADNTAPSPDEEQNWQLLFNDDATHDWQSIATDTFPGKEWKLQNGLLTGTGEGGDILSRKQYGNFELQWEWKMLTKGGNSGVKYFVSDYGKDGKKQWLGLEYQILDDENFSWMSDGRMKPGDFRTMASLYEIYPAPNKRSKPVGEWNTSRIVAQGNHLEHWLNGEMVLECERGSEDFRERVSQSKFAAYENFGEAERGHILIQDHGSEMEFRNMRIREHSATKPAGQ